MLLPGLAFSAVLAPAAAAQPVIRSFSNLAALDATIDAALAGTDARITEDRVPAQGSDQLVLLRVDGMPAFVHARGRQPHDRDRTSFA